VKWIIATAQAKPRDAGVSALPADWPPDDEFGPPPDDVIFEGGKTKGVDARLPARE
jgi:hypothetical protein